MIKVNCIEALYLINTKNVNMELFGVLQRKRMALLKETGCKASQTGLSLGWGGVFFTLVNIFYFVVSPFLYFSDMFD